MESEIYTPKVSTGKIIAVEYQLYEPTGVYLTTPEAVHQIMLDSINHISEELHVLILNVKNSVLKILVGKGSHNSVIISPADILRTVFATGGSNIIITHQHPSGDCQPSEEDICFTRKLNQACKVVSINLLDHVVYTKDEYYSFKKEGLL